MFPPTRFYSNARDKKFILKSKYRKLNLRACGDEFTELFPIRNQSTGKRRRRCDLFAKWFKN